MDFTLLAQLSGFGLVASLLVQALKTIYGGLSERFGALISQLVLLAVSLVVAAVAAYLNYLPVQFTEGVLAIFATAIVIYEFVYKAVIQQAIRGK